MSFSRLWTIARLELLQRVRTVSWYVLLGVFAVVLLALAASWGVVGWQRARRQFA